MLVSGLNLLQIEFAGEQQKADEKEDSDQQNPQRAGSKNSGEEEGGFLLFHDLLL